MGIVDGLVRRGVVRVPRAFGAPRAFSMSSWSFPRALPELAWDLADILDLAAWSVPHHRRT